MNKDSNNIKENELLIMLVPITLLGFALRLYFFIGNDFPLHDGGFLCYGQKYDNK